jgi:hypothetical protein
VRFWEYHLTEEHPDLFWVLRGADANMAIATALEFEVHEVGIGSAHDGTARQAFTMTSVTRPLSFSLLALVSHSVEDFFRCDSGWFRAQKERAEQ